MKRLIPVLLLVTLLLTFGCARGGPDKPAGDAGGNVPTASKHTATVGEAELPRYLVPTASLPGGVLFGMSGNQINAWNPENGGVENFGEAWSAVLSPDGQKIACINEQGLYIMDTVSGTRTLVAGNAEDGSTLAPGVWSPESDKFMYMFVREWSSDFYVYNLAGGENRLYEFQNVPNFLSRPVDWRENGLLFVVHANKSKTGEQEYRESGYRADLMLADDEGNLNPLTRLDDGQFALYGGAARDNKTMLVVVWEGDSRTSAALVNLANGETVELPVGDNTTGGSISPDGKFAVLVTAIEEGRFSARVFDLESKTGILEHQLAGYQPPHNFMWSEDSRTVSFGVPGDGDKGTLYTVKIE